MTVNNFVNYIQIIGFRSLSNHRSTQIDRKFSDRYFTFKITTYYITPFFKIRIQKKFDEI